jgi:ATP-binding cassette subfamily C protein/ATP-binding cassette subfamily C exporter for protease/lipase/ATP-binding cassette subfamily C protein EexD
MLGHSTEEDSFMTVASRRSSGRRRTKLDDALRICRKAFLFVGLFSIVINILMLASPLYMLQVYDRVLTTGRTETLLLLTIMAGSALLILGALEALRSSILARVGAWLNAQLGPTFLAASVRARLSGNGTSAQSLRDLAQLQSFVGGQGVATFFDAPWVPLFVVLIWFLHPVLGVVALVSAFTLFGLTLLNDYLTRSPIREATRAQITANLQAEATVRNAEVVQAMGMLPTLVERWQSTNQTAMTATQLAGERGGTIVGFTKFARFFVQMAILGVGALLVLRGELTAGGMVAASILLGRALAPVEQSMGAWKTFTSARLAYARLKEAIEGDQAEERRTRLPAPTGRISVENVSYAAVQGERPILSQVSLALEPGEALAIIGASAAGKSTLCRALVGIVRPNLGIVRLDGADLRHWDPEELGQHIGYLPQDVELFSGTVRENIARMSKGSDEDVVAAAQLAHAHEMILRLPQGYDTRIGDGGARLSGGQRQRVGLARAVFGQPKVVVLDEPNANLDQAGESALAAAITRLKELQTTLIIVGHRPSTLRRVDKILVLREGRVEAFGPRDQIIEAMRDQAARAVPTAPAPERVAGGGPRQVQAAASRAASTS